jgi:hypothetical protein
MPLIKRRRVLAAKIETTAGTAESLTSSEAGFNVYDVEINADIPMYERKAEGSLSMLPAVPGARSGSIKFSIDAYGSGTGGTSPTWALTLLKGCGMTESSGTFSLTSTAASMKTLTLGVYEDGLFKSLAGAMGNFTVDGEDGKPLKVTFEYTGVWQAPTDVSLIAPTYATTVPPRFAGAAFTIGGTSPILSKFNLKSGNVVTLREDITKTAGYIAAVITDRKFEGNIDPEAKLVASSDVFGNWIAGTEAALSCAVGSGGNAITIAAPAIQYMKITEGDRNGIQTHGLDFMCMQNGATPDTEVTIAF